MDFIAIPLIVWICVSGVYGLFELFARRGERKAIIEKMGDKLDSSLLVGKFSMPNLSFKSFSSLKIGCLMVGLGLGLLVGLFISMIFDNAGFERWRLESLTGVAYCASVLLFGGIGLLVSFIIENKMNKKSLP